MKKAFDFEFRKDAGMSLPGAFGLSEAQRLEIRDHIRGHKRLKVTEMIEDAAACFDGPMFLYYVYCLGAANECWGQRAGLSSSF